MSWSSPDGWLTRLFSGDPLAILIVFLITISLPIITHTFLYTTAARTRTTPSFLLLGPTSAGKTSLLTLLQRRSCSSEAPEASPTRTSQQASQSKLILPKDVPLGSNRLRSLNDVALQDLEEKLRRYEMIDTPGHGKLRLEQAFAFLKKPGLKGIIFVVDAAALDGTNQSSLRETVTYLHDTLLALQRIRMGETDKTRYNRPFLIAANKQDLFTALPPGAVRDRLEKEVQAVKESRNRGLIAVDQKEDAEDAETTILGGGGEDSFTFKSMGSEYGIFIDVLGGAVRGEEAGKGVRRWEEWIGECL